MLVGQGDGERQRYKAVNVLRNLPIHYAEVVLMVV